MSNKQPEALRLADALEACPVGCTCCAHSYAECGCVDSVWPEMAMRTAAAELRRLHAQRDELLEALKAIVGIDAHSILTEADADAIHQQARAAIAKAEAK